MRGSIYHADISNGLNVRVYSTEPPEGAHVAPFFVYFSTILSRKILTKNDI